MKNEDQEEERSSSIYHQPISQVLVVSPDGDKKVKVKIDGKETIVS